ncbi:hypothetical protein QUA82_09260 [Microcoleus sp. F8-D3]
MNFTSNCFNSLTESLLSHRRYIPAALTICTGTSLSLAAAGVVWHGKTNECKLNFISKPIA